MFKFKIGQQVAQNSYYSGRVIGKAVTTAGNNIYTVEATGAVSTSACFTALEQDLFDNTPVKRMGVVYTPQEYMILSEILKRGCAPDIANLAEHIAKQYNPVG